jgi:hypothetical protein
MLDSEVKPQNSSRVQNCRRLPPQAFECKREKQWRAQGDDFRTFLGQFVEAVTQMEFPVGLSL